MRQRRNNMIKKEELIAKVAELEKQVAEKDTLIADLTAIFNEAQGKVMLEASELDRTRGNLQALYDLVLELTKEDAPDPEDQYPELVEMRTAADFQEILANKAASYKRKLKLIRHFVKA